MKKLFAAAAFAAMIAGGGTSAFANSCPKDMKAIDAALSSNPTITSEQLAQVTKLRAEGETLHNSGNHADSVKALHEAEQILGIK